MRIIILADQFSRALGGAVGVGYHQALGLSRRGHQVTVLTASPPPAGLEGVLVRQMARPFHPRWGATLGLYHPAAVRQVRAALRELAPDVVHAHNLYQALSYRCLAEACRVTPRVFLTAHDVMSFAYAKLTHYIDSRRTDCPQPSAYHTPWTVNLQTAKKRYNPFRNAYIRRRLHRITKVLAVSQALADALADNGITNVAVVHNGIDLKAWSPPPADRLGAFQKRHHLQGKRILLCAGRLSGAKGMNQVLSAFSKINAQVPNTVLLFAGGADGGLTAYRQLPERYGVDGLVQFAGPLSPDDMVLAYHACDVVVVPSVCFDSFPSVNLEAMAASKPVVATCFGGSREAVADGQTGFIVNPYDTAALADRIIRLLRDQELAVRLGVVGRQRVAQEFSAEHWLDALEAWYRR